MDNPLSIVVVDDAPSSVELINTTLSRSGYADIRISSDPRNVMPMLNERHADIVLIDWIMPELDGLALAERIRQLDEETNHYTAIIIITARAGIEHRHGERGDRLPRTGIRPRIRSGEGTRPAGIRRAEPAPHYPASARRPEPSPHVNSVLRFCPQESWKSQKRGPCRNRRHRS